MGIDGRRFQQSNHSRARGARARGRISFSTLPLLALAAAFVYITVVTLPPYVAQLQMRRATEEVLRRGAGQNLDTADIRAQLLEMAREHGLPAETVIEVTRDGRSVTARVAYARNINLLFRSWPWQVDMRVVDLGI